MTRFALIVAVLLLSQASAVSAQTACPTDGSCPTDVGACLAESCPCDRPGNAWKNHGQYVKCVVHLRNDLRNAGCLDAEAKRTIASCAARSTCGKEGAVLCCTYDTSATCSDATPSNTIAEGVCSSDGTTACDTATDCITVVKGPKVVRGGEEACVARGGTPIGTGSVCGGCPEVPPAP